jgi:hypothetical protein
VSYLQHVVDETHAPALWLICPAHEVLALCEVATWQGHAMSQAQIKGLTQPGHLAHIVGLQKQHVHTEYNHTSLHDALPHT